MAEEKGVTRITLFIPERLPDEVGELSSASLQEATYREKRSTLIREITKGAQALAASTGIISSLKLGELSGGELYRSLSGPLQKTKDGVCGGVIRDSKGRIVKHARFEKVELGPWMSATACAAQVMLISIALQLNQIQKALEEVRLDVEALIDFDHRERVSRIKAGIAQFEDLFLAGDLEKVELLAPVAIQSLQEGLQATIMCLEGEIRQAVRKSGGIMTRLKLAGLNAEAVTCLSRAQDSFEWSLKGLKALVECQALLGMREVSAFRLKNTLEQIREADLETTAKLASRIPSRGEELPEKPWNDFLEAYPAAMERLDEVASLVSRKAQSLDVEMPLTPEDLALE